MRPLARAALLLCAALALADTRRDYYSDGWQTVAEERGPLVDLGALVDPRPPAARSSSRTGAAYALTLALPHVARKDIVVEFDAASRTLTVAASSTKLGAAASRESYLYSEVIPLGFSGPGRWWFGPDDALTVEFPAEGGAARAPHPEDYSASSVWRGGGAGVLASDPAARVTWSASEYSSERRTVRGGGGPAEHPSGLPVRPVAAAATSAATGAGALLGTSLLFLFIQ